MPAGNPRFEVIRYHPSISQLVERGTISKKDMRMLLTIIIKNFCDTVNVPKEKNLNSAQLVEVAGFLLDECGNFRVEDYVIMFTMAKRGRLEIGKKGRVFDRVDIQLISDFKDNYEHLRQQGAYILQEKEAEEKEKSLSPGPINENEPIEVKEKRFDDALKMLKEMQKAHNEGKEAEKERERLEYQERKEKFEQISKEAESNGYFDVVKFINDKNFNKNEENSNII